MRKFFKEFKEFINRGNVLDLAVAVIIGSAFSAIVTALTNKVIMPLINLLLSAGGENGLESAYTFLRKVEVDGVVDMESSIYIDWGAFITAIINFILIALVVFVIVKIFNASAKKFREIEKKAIQASKKETIQAKKACYAKAKAEGRKFKEVWTEYKLEQKALAEAKAKAEAEEKAQKELEEKLNNPSEQELLKQIRDLLAKEK